MKSTERVRPVLYVAAIAAACLLTAFPDPVRQAAAQQPVPDPTFKYTNKLIDASSPYLLEHAHNPVNWYPWGPEALDKARRENKPIFLSVGYSACHWCHVMAHEDFENEEIAAILNKNFVAIKVDREQRPDIDAQYMLAVQIINGSGGWPLSVFLTPDRKPFFGGTYFPPAEFKALLNQVVDVYAKQADAVRAQADKVQATIAVTARSTPGGRLPGDILQQAAEGLKAHFDGAEGGFSKQPKFPEAPDLAFLLARYGKTGDKSLLDMVTLTLDKMADGGIYDQIGGGFHRYSTDAHWLVPHFEKMLSDQAQLVLIYLDAYRITHKPRYRQIVEETLAFVNRELRDPDGGFVSSIDADSEGVEGKFYLWTPEQVHEVLGDDARLFDTLYGVTAAGLIGGKSVLHVAGGIEQTARQFHLSMAELERRAASMRARMLAARSERVRPKTDDKVLASWNGLMIAAFARAAAVLSSPDDRKTAEEAAQFVSRTMTNGADLFHCYRAGRAEISGLLEDYAYLSFGIVELAQTADHSDWNKRAQALTSRMIALLGDDKNGGFYAATAAAEAELLVRQKSGEDNAVPSPNGVAALVLLRLGAASGDPALRRSALRTVQSFEPLEVQAPAAFPTLLTACQELGGDAVLTSVQVPVILHEGHRAPIGATEVRIDIVADIGPEWHINGNHPSSPELIPTVLTLKQGGGSLIRVDYPAAKKARFEYSVEPLAVYVGRTTFRATVRRPKAGSANRRLRFVLKYQPCNTRACLPPATTEITIGGLAAK